MTSITEFLRKYPVTMTCQRVETNPNFDPDAWSRKARHFKCILSYEERSMSIFFSQGSAHREDPTLEEVLDCVANGALGVDATFETWADELSYDPDSRRAERIYNVCRTQAAQFQLLLGAEAFDALVYHTDRC